MQPTVKIINIKKSAASGKTFDSTIFESAWKKGEAQLRKDGWVLADQIESITVEKVEDGLGLEEVVVEESKEEEKVVPLSDTMEGKDYVDMTKEELQKACDDKGIKYHHANKERKLIQLLEA